MKRFMEALEEEEERKKEQERLHAKHKITDENVVVVEKNNVITFSIKSIGAVMRIGSTLILLVLAATGLLCIIYPETRQALLRVMEQLAGQVNQLF